MKRLVLGIGLIVILVTLILNINLPLTDTQIVGTYINTNYENDPCCVDTPHTKDTLILKADMTFLSDFYGNGTYKVNHGLLTTEISWTYKYEFGLAGYNTYFKNKIFKSPKIVLNSDLEHYYEKIR